MSVDREGRKLSFAAATHVSVDKEGPKLASVKMTVVSVDREDPKLASVGPTPVSVHVAREGPKRFCGTNSCVCTCREGEA